MQEAQRRQLAVGSVIAVTVGIVLYHVLFKKPNSQISNANDKTESKQEQTEKEALTTETATAGKTPAEPDMDVVTKEEEDNGVAANTVEATPIEVTEKPSIVSTEESIQESGSEEDEIISVADGESTDATEEELVKDVDSNAVSVRHISEQSENTDQIVMPDAVEPVQEIESVKEQSEPAVNVDNIEAREPTVPKEPWSDLPAVNETNVWESPDWAAQQEAKSSSHSELNVNCEPFVPKGNLAKRPEPTPEEIAEARRQMILKQRQRGASYKARCKYWPKCTNKKCKYVHPMYPCRNDPNCKFGDRCIYYHAKDMDARIK
ncbi:hypothetical protein INT43_001371 [Umbelopsis isabellina]|uniref:C3H1-type domain-containing protein n=1 Tax=Mortierella isabellina TaxID=91625 RepID=A0A8H7PKC1_MORIS|nr:hypothetical protein INT43_001371 [Umbelopsis isabellina]